MLISFFVWWLLWVIAEIMLIAHGYIPPWYWRHWSAEQLEAMREAFWGNEKDA